jgi:hypothetical protein
MLRIERWGGLVTAVSPYVVPAGGAVEQVNAQSRSPGQLTVRGGMAPVTPHSPAATPILEMWGYSPGSGGTDSIFLFTADGQIRRIESPAVDFPEPR